MELKAARIKEFRLITACLAAIFALQFVAPYLATSFQKSIFTPLQLLRGALFGCLPFSLGDCLYAALILLLLWRFKKYLAQPTIPGTRTLMLLRSVRRLLGLYLLLLILWGLLYEQAKLCQQMKLPELSQLTSAELVAFDSLLIQRMNEGQASYQYPGLQACNQELASAYKKSGIAGPLKAKPSMFGKLLPYLGIQGYYNPFTGEAQVCTGEPNFMMPFLIAHELAHQTGIAAEDDANLAAYISCMESNNKHLQYSASFNLWLYVHRRVHRIDSAEATRLKEQLNPASLAQLDTLRQRARQYYTWLDEASSFLFDVYLKMEQQEAGINSYRNVAWSALAWEKQRNNIYLAR